jgi:dTDP-glucose 4,6-dehydratase
VYGDPKEHPQQETYWGHVNPIGPRGVYDEAKRYAEALTMAYHRQQGVDTAIVRIFNTYGSRMRPHDGRAIPTFLRQALANRPLTVFGDGSQTRSFCFVSDLIRGLIALAESGYHNPVNIGNPDEYTLLELAEAVKEITGAASEILFEALPVDDPKQRRPDITLARELLSWAPEVSLRYRAARRLSTVAQTVSDRFTMSQTHTHARGRVFSQMVSDRLTAPHSHARPRTRVSCSWVSDRYIRETQLL